MNITRKIKWEMLLLAIPFCFVVGSAPLERWHYETSDEISRSAIDTKKILQRYESTNDPNEIRLWLLNGPTEAPGTQMQMTLGNWAVEHQKHFVTIIENLPSNEREKFIDRFLSSLESPSLQNFKLTFGNNHSPLIKRMLNQIG